MPIAEEEPDGELQEIIRRYSAVEESDECIIPKVPLRKLAKPGETA